MIFIIWAGAGNPFKIADLDLKRYGIEIATGGGILPAPTAYKQLPGMEGARRTTSAFEDPVNSGWWPTTASKSPPDFFGRRHEPRLIAWSEA